jgi:DNA polymerase III sliding clamp (beta) subunit (PCNA family)
MTVSVQREALVAALRVCSAVEPKLRIGTLFEASKGVFTITADNYEIHYHAEVPATIEGESSLVLPSGRLLQLLSSATAEEVTITARDEQPAQVVCGDVSCLLTGLPVSEFPTRTTLPAQASFKVPELKKALEWVAPVTEDSLHPGVHFAANGKHLQVEALDGRQLHAASVECAATLDVIASPKITGLIHPGECVIETTARTISFRQGGSFILAQLLEGQFPDTAAVIPASEDNKLFRLPKSDLVRALNAAQAVFEKNLGTHRVNISVSADSTAIRTDHCAPGLVETTIAAPNSCEVGFQIDPLRLLASLKHLDADNVQLQCDDSLSRVCIRDGDFLAVIALMRAP